MKEKPVPTQGSAGGHARAASLTTSQRKEIARRAAAAKWNIPVASHEGELPLAGWRNFPCWVLNDQRRVISQRSFMAAIGMYSTRIPLAERVSQLLDPRNTRSASAVSLVMRLERPIRFYTKEYVEAYGYEGDIIIEFCRAILYARRVGNLTGVALEYADLAERLLVSVANTGIAALIDSVCGKCWPT